MADGYAHHGTATSYFPPMTRLYLSVAILLLSFTGIQAKDLSAAFLDRALASMKSSDSRKRKAAYRTFQYLGADAIPAYKIILQKAQLYHQSVMRRTMGARGNPYAEHARVFDALNTERERVMKLIHTDWKKDPGKIRMLHREVERIGRNYQRTNKLASSKTESFDKKMTTSFDALVEIQWELFSLKRSEDGENTSDKPNQEELKDAVYEDNIEAGMWREQKKKWALTRKFIQSQKKARTHNAACRWANASQKKFSNLLNDQRAIMGLSPLLLEQQLSAAAWGHSNDMRTGGFFSHTSPVPGKRTPADRARKAKFTGRWTGENIFMGSPSYTSAYNGWFGSDGHRFIMFTRGNSNVLGVGVDGGYWTMMTGRK